MLLANHSVYILYAVHTSATGTRLYYKINKLQYYYIIYIRLCVYAYPRAVQVKCEINGLNNDSVKHANPINGYIIIQYCYNDGSGKKS